MATETLTESERDIMQHALGLDNRNSKGKPFRNYFACEPDDTEYLPIWEGLRARGLCTRRDCGPITLVYFHLTEAGAAALGHKLPKD